MSQALERAKSLQTKVANETQCWIRLDLLEALIAEIEELDRALAAAVARIDALDRGDA